MPGQEQPKKLEVTKCAMLQRPWEDIGGLLRTLPPPTLSSSLGLGHIALME